MKQFLTLTACSILIFAGIIGPVALSYRPYKQPALKIAIYDNLMPGYNLPNRSTCGYEGTFANSPDLFCAVGYGDQVIHLDYRRDTGVIDYAYYADLQDTVLGLFYVWGQPSGYRHEGSSWWFYWADRSAYVVPKYGLDYESIVGVLVFGSPTLDFLAWPQYGGLPNN